jgi:hypothetical protein
VFNKAKSITFKNTFPFKIGISYRGVGKNRGISVIENSYKKFPIRKWTYQKMMPSKFPICPKMDI